MSKRFVSLMLLGSIAVGLSYARTQQQSGGRPASAPLPPTFLYDDDGGRTQVIPPGFIKQWKVTYHGGMVLPQPVQESVFLGSAWAQPAHHAREAALANLVGYSSKSERAKALHFGLQPRAASVSIHEYLFDDDFVHGTQPPSVNDLQIQSRLAEMLRTSLLPVPTANSVYMVYLPPGVQSLLGGNKAGRDYVAYHNFIRFDQGLVVYVVIPFEPDVAAAQSLAWHAFAEAALDPTEDGWF